MVVWWGGVPRAFVGDMVAQVKGWLISNRSTSAVCQPVLSSRRSGGPMGAVVNWAGARAWAVWATTRATALRPLASAVEARVMTKAAAPSEMELALAAVRVPYFEKAGRRPGILEA